MRDAAPQCRCHLFKLIVRHSRSNNGSGMDRHGSKACVFSVGCVTAGELLLLPGLSFPIYDTMTLFHLTTRPVQVWMIEDSLIDLSMN